MARKKKNRCHYKAEQLECRQMIDKMLADGYIYDDIVAAVKDAGERISKSALQRYHNSFEQVAERITKTREQMKVLIDAVRDQPGTDLAEAANQVMMQGLLTRIATAGDEFDELGLEKAGRLVATLERSAVAREKLKLQYDRAITIARDQILGELKESLRGQPEILASLSSQVEKIMRGISEEL